jgi:peptide/nickel transport system substrate-binding protein
MKVRRSVLLFLIFTLILALLASACSSGGATVPEATTNEAGETTDTGEVAEPTAEAEVMEEATAEPEVVEEPTAEPEVVEEEPTAPAEEEPAAGAKVVTISFVQEPDNLNPLYTTMWFSAITRDFWLRSLWNFDDNNEAVPQLAVEVPSEENGGITNGGQTLTIQLNPDAVWSDGEPVTAADFVFTYDMIISEANTTQSTYPYADFVASVEAPDDHTLVVNFNEPFAPWLTNIFTYVLPEHILGPVFEAEGTLDTAEWNRAPSVGVGPFVFAEWESGSHIRFTRNENWLGEAPLVDEVFIRIVPDDAAQIAAIKASDTDIGVFLSYSDVEDIESAGVADVVAVSSGYDEGWFLNVDPETAHPAMLDVNVRQAIAMATNRDQITQDLLLGLTEPPATFWDSTAPYGDPSLEPYPYDPEQAATLLDEAGWVDSNGDGTRDKDGVELVLRYITNDRQLRADVQAVVQQMWAEVGIGAELVNHSSDIFWNSYGDGGPQAIGEYDIAQYSSVGAFPDPEASSNWLCSQIPSPDNPEGANWQGYCNEELDALLQEQAVTVDPEARVQLYYNIERIMYDDVIWIGIWKDPDLWSINSRLSNVRFSGASPFWNVEQWDVTG